MAQIVHHDFKDWWVFSNKILKRNARKNQTTEHFYLEKTYLSHYLDKNCTVHVHFKTNFICD